ncbi:MAG: trypsin-like peptidase domain-containing protein [Mogibacterium sp.]|nr:trypsin-like peptidase domain-containing protein [Mogibacterium sp.]
MDDYRDEFETTLKLTPEEISGAQQTSDAPQTDEEKLDMLMKRIRAAAPAAASAEPAAPVQNGLEQELFIPIEEATPTEPLIPAEPTAAIDPVIPVPTVQSEPPAEPEVPVEPVVPETPVLSETPVEPVIPAEPVVPKAPVQSASPAAPLIPPEEKIPAEPTVTFVTEDLVPKQTFKPEAPKQEDSLSTIIGSDFDAFVKDLRDSSSASRETAAGAAAVLPEAHKPAQAQREPRASRSANYAPSQRQEGRTSGYNYNNGPSAGRSSTDYTSYRSETSGRSAGASRQKPADLSKYVTKKALAAAIICTMLVSSVVGAAVGMIAGKSSASSAVANQLAGQEQEHPLEIATNSAMTIEDIVRENENSVVEINTQITMMSMWGSTESEAAGSGVIVRDNGYIVTNYHVIEDAHAINVTLHNGEEYSAQVVGIDQQNDLAVLKIDGDDFDPVTYGNSDDLDVGDLTVAIGNPLGQLGGTATSGIISALDRKLDLDGKQLNLLQTDSAINPGNSGGGLFDENGKLIGIVVAKSSGTGIEGLGFAIPINTAAPIIDDLIENGKISNRPAAGIKIYEVTEDRLETFGVDAPGVYIGEVNGTNAKKAGLQEGDRIIAFEGERIESSAAVVAAIQQHKIGDEVTFTVMRNGEMIDITFALENSANFS